MFSLFNYVTHLYLSAAAAAESVPFSVGRKEKRVSSHAPALQRKEEGGEGLCRKLFFSA